MRSRAVAIGGILALAAAGAFSALSGCSGRLVLNLTKERTGNITLVFINDTPHAAGFSFGTWDAWDKSPGPTELHQLSVDPHTSSEVAESVCRRNLAVGTQAFIDRVLDYKADETDAFIPEIFDTVVHFTRGIPGSDVAGLPTAGTAEGIELLLGIDYSCADEVVFTFVEDPDAPGGFRIDFEVILDKRPNE